MIQMKKWFKIIGRVLGGFIVLLLIGGLVFNQMVFRLIFGLGYMDVYNGNNDRGNQIMKYAMSHMDSIDAQTYHSLSVQNTKNGNYDLAMKALNKSYAMDSSEVGAYLGWVLLYYYRDYERALEVLEEYDALTPDFSDAPMGEDIHYLKGLAHMQMRNWIQAKDEFERYINESSETFGEKYVDVYAFVQLGRCYARLEEWNQAIRLYKQAIRNYKECSEAYYYMGLAQIELGESDKACYNLNTADSLIQNGYKSSDTYIEYFHEIYPQQIQIALQTNCDTRE